MRGKQREILITLRPTRFYAKMFGDYQAEYITEDGLKYAGLGFGKWYAIKSLVESLIKDDK